MPLNWGFTVGRPGLDPGTLGLKVGAHLSMEFYSVHRPWWSGVAIPAVTSEYCPPYLRISVANQ